MPAEVLWPERESLYDLMLHRAMIGHAAFMCEKQNEPIDPAACEFDPSCLDWPGMWFDAWKLNELAIKVISLDPSKGRALALGTPIATPRGWTTIGELQVGDEVFAGDGTPTRVSWVSQVWRDRPVYRVKTKTGGEILADENHEWLVRLRRPMKSAGYPAVYSRRTTGFLHKRQLEMEEFRPPLVDCHPGLQLPESLLPCPPYTLGAWLGDGNSHDSRITQTDEDGIHLFGRIHDEGFNVAKYAGYDWKVHGLREPLRRACVLRNKHIPSCYFRASHEQRLALLNGLIDTDGTVSKIGQVEFVSVTESLAYGVKRLLTTLGVKSNVIKEFKKLSSGDVDRRLQESGEERLAVYRVRFYYEHAASMPRKLARCRSMRSMGHYLEVEPSGNADTVCIGVDHPSHLFLAGEEMVPTHNSDKTGDYSAIVLYGRDSAGIEYVEADLARRPVERICHDLAAWAKWFNPDAVAVETNQFQELLLSPLQEAAKAAGIVTLPTYRIDNMVPKQVRIRRLSAPLSQKRLRFKAKSPGTQLTVQQLRDWPQGDHQDGPDALEMARRLAIELLNKGGKRR